MSTRTRTIEWEDPKAAAALGQTMSGIEYLQAIIDGKIPAAPIAKLFGFALAKVAPGLAVFTLPIGEHMYNPIGSVHGGTAATLLDSVMGCCIHTLLPAGRVYSTLEIKINYLRPITDALADVTAEGRVINLGRKAAFSEGKIFDAAGKIYATGTSTCAVWDV
jgi:uncharacterized protein (TIGR00369 family)